MADPVLDAHLIAEQGAELRGHGTRGRHISLDVSGAVSVPVAGVDAVTLRLVGDVTSVAFTGWTGTAELAGSGLGVGDLHQSVTVTVLQDATGGHAFDPFGVNGVWLEEPPEVMSTVADDVVIRFTASTTDGVTVWLALIGSSIEALATRSVRAAVEPVPALNGTVGAPATATFQHPFDPVTSVQVVSKAVRGDGLTTGWWQSDGLAHAEVNVDFDFAVAANEFEVRIAGEAKNDTPIRLSSVAWKTLPINVTGPGLIRAIVDHDGLTSEAEWVWPDGTKTPVVTGFSTPHTAAAAGVAMLRWRRDVNITRLDLQGGATWDLAVSVCDLPPSLNRLIIGGTASSMQGNIADLPPAMEDLFAQVSNVELTGNQLPEIFREFHIGSTNSVVVMDVANFPPGLVDFRAFSTRSRIRGDIGSVPSTLTLMHLGNTPSTVEFVSATGGALPFSRQLSLSYAADGAAMTVAQINGLLVDLAASGVTPTAPAQIELQGPHPNPDATSGGVDGLAAVATLQGNGWTVTT